jgi:pyruvate formate lyase activating enzyme
MKKAGVHIEITNLLIPGLNDAEEEVGKLCDWMTGNGLADVPLHLSRYFPRYKMTEPGPTPRKTLLAARDIALSKGIRSVYLGNI